MDQPVHSLGDLFAQLGLPADDASIDAFIRAHSPIPAYISLADASFWNPSQAAFLKQQWLGDADWAEAVDQLDLALRCNRNGPALGVLFVCEGNADLSQMAEALLRRIAGNRFDVRSAGLVALPLERAAVEVMREIGIDISRHASKTLSDFADRKFDYVITLCDTVKGSCIDFPRDGHNLHWHFEHPRIAGESAELHLARFRAIRDGLQRKLEIWTAGICR